MIRQRVLVAALLPFVLGCVSRSSYQTAQDQLNAANKRIKELEGIAMESGEGADRIAAEKARLAQENQNLAQQLRSASSSSGDSARRIAELQAEVERLGKQSPGITGVEMVQGNGTFTYRVGGEFLFDPGKDEVKASGKKTLGEVAALLRQHDHKIEIAGHTDTDPVKATKDRYPLGNIELASHRAMAVWSALKEAGIPEERMIVASYGQYEPVDPKDKSRNRRVEIRVLLQEPEAL